MSIEIENPETLVGKIDAAANLIEQIGLALSIGDINHAKQAKESAARLLRLATDEVAEFEYSGAGLIAGERARQVSSEGWTPAHDDAHRTGELLDAGLSYGYAAINVGHPAMARPPKEWPWTEEWWKPSEDPVRNLVKAGALFAAEIDRVQRARMNEDSGE